MTKKQTTRKVKQRCQKTFIKTNDKITGRLGLAFFLRYIEKIGFYELSEKLLGHIRISSKGLSLYQFIKQMLAYFIDGTYMSIKSFNNRKKDCGYTALLENQEKTMSSSHQVKRFFRELMNNHIGNAIFRKILNNFFSGDYRLKNQQP